MKVEYHGTGKNRHVTVWDDSGEWVATVRAGREAEAIDALAVGANGSHRPESESSEKD